jgi:hypothetical protein
MTRSTEAFEDVIAQLTGALVHASKALDNAAVAVNLMSSAQREVQNTPVYTPHYSMPTKQDPPHLVVVRMRKCLRGRGRAVSDVGKTICQLRRYDNDKWLWTSRPYAHGELALRDASKTAELYGWRIVAEAEDSAHLAAESPEDGLPASEEKQEPTEVPQVEAEPAAPDDTTDPNGPFQRGFAAGMSTKHGLLRALADHLTKAAKGETRTTEALGEIAVIVEKELGLEQCALWPDKEVPDLSADTRRRLSEMMTLLLLTKQGKIEINTGAQKVAARLEKTLGLAEGAIWPEKFQAPNSPNAVLFEHVRRQEQLLAFIVVQLGQNMDYGARLLRHICAKYVELGFPEDIKTATFRHLDTRATFATLEATTHD